MILSSLARTWPLVLRGTSTGGEAGALLGSWPMRPAELAALDRYADIIAGVFRGQVVAVYGITGRRPEKPAERAEAQAHGLGRRFDRVIFEGSPSPAWAHKVGSSNPGKPFTQWPVQYLDTATVWRY